MNLDDLETLAHAATPGPWFPSGPENAYGNPTHLAAKPFDPEEGDHHDTAGERWTVASAPASAASAGSTYA